MFRVPEAPLWTRRKQSRLSASSDNQYEILAYNHLSDDDNRKPRYSVPSGKLCQEHTECPGSHCGKLWGLRTKILYPFHILKKPISFQKESIESEEIWHMSITAKSEMELLWNAISFLRKKYNFKLHTWVLTYLYLYLEYTGHLTKQTRR